MKHLCIATLCFLIASCSSGRNDMQLVTKEVVPIRIDDLGNIDTLFSVDRLNNCSFVRLETSEECLLGAIVQLEVFENQIFVLDRNFKLLVFDIGGNYLRSIGPLGKGPGEMLTKTHFYINEDKRYIGVYDPGASRMFRYSFDGSFVESFHLDRSVWYKIDRMHSPGGGHLVLSYVNDPINPYNFALVCEDDYSLVKKFLPFTVIGKVSSTPEKARFAPSKGHSFFTGVFSDTIYCFSGDYYSPFFLLETGRDHIDAVVANRGGPFEVYMEAINPLIGGGYSRGIGGVYATDDVLYFDFFNDSDTCFYEVFWSLENNFGRYSRDRDRSNSFIAMSPILTCTDDAFVSVIYPFWAIKSLDGMIGKLHPGIEESIRGLGEEDNPIVAFYRFPNLFIR